MMSRLDRQSFLGVDSDDVLSRATIGFVGLGGGGSHLVQQLAHLGIGGFVLVDPDVIDLTNTNRLVGGTLADVQESMSKAEIANRLICGLQPRARVKVLKADWRLVLDDLKDSDVIIGAVDSYTERDQLERLARRFLIPYIDIGMDVLDLANGHFLINGQVILSNPGGHCLRCCNFITDERLAREAERYGAAGNRPQVIWANGVLASTAVGIAIELLTPWHEPSSEMVYLEYDGNRKTIVKSRWATALEGKECAHYAANETGDPAFDIRQVLATKQTKPPMPIKVQIAPKVSVPRWRQLLTSWFG